MEYKIWWKLPYIIILKYIIYYIKKKYSRHTFYGFEFKIKLTDSRMIIFYKTNSPFLVYCHSANKWKKEKKEERNSWLNAFVNFGLFRCFVVVVRRSWDFQNDFVLYDFSNVKPLECVLEGRVLPSIGVFIVSTPPQKMLDCLIFNELLFLLFNLGKGDAERSLL